MLLLSIRSGALGCLQAAQVQSSYHLTTLTVRGDLQEAQWAQATSG